MSKEAKPLARDLWEIEAGYWGQGERHLAGIDEVGRGPLAGPVVAAACVLPPPDHPRHLEARTRLAGLNDSKQLSESRRVHFASEIRDVALAWAIAELDAAEIDRLNILRASQAAMATTVRRVRRSLAVDRLLVDGHLVIPKLRARQVALIQGDGRSISIAAASVLAKVHRDALMVALHERYPGYGFDRHKGYPTLEHREAILRLGLTPLHRRSFAPCQL